MTAPLPKWVSELRARDPWTSFKWLEEAESNAIRTQWLDVWSQVTFDKHFHERCREQLTRCVPLATGPSNSRRLSKAANQLTLVFDPEQPSRIATSLSHAMPSACWSWAEEGELAKVLAVYLSAEAPKLDGVARVVKPLDVPDPGTITQAMDASELWIDDAFWGSSFSHDPWSEVEPDLDMLALSIFVQRFDEQDPSRFPARGCRTLWSRSTMRIEQHPRGLFVFDLRFPPAGDAWAIRRLNELMDMRLPEELPVDVAASLLRGSTLSAFDVDELEQRGDAPFEALALRCALAPSSPPTLERLRAAIAEHAADARLLAAIASLASSYHHDELLFEIAHLAPEHLRQELEAFLQPASGAP